MSSAQTNPHLLHSLLLTLKLSPFYSRFSVNHTGLESKQIKKIQKCKAAIPTPRSGTRSQKQNLNTQAIGGSRTVAKQKVSTLDSSAQLAFLSRNLVCSFDFLVAKQFFSWMGTANLLQQSSTIKNQFFCFEGVSLSYFCGPWVGNLFAFKEATHLKIFELLIRFWEPILGPVLVTLSRLFPLKGSKFNSELHN